MTTKMSREQYANYLRTQAWWITELAAEIQQGGDGSTNSWGVDFDLLKPDAIREGLPCLPTYTTLSNTTKEAM